MKTYQRLLAWGSAAILLSSVMPVESLESNHEEKQSDEKSQSTSEVSVQEQLSGNSFELSMSSSISSQKLAAESENNSKIELSKDEIQWIKKRIQAHLETGRESKPETNDETISRGTSNELTASELQLLKDQIQNEIETGQSLKPESKDESEGVFVKDQGILDGDIEEKSMSESDSGADSADDASSSLESKPSESGLADESGLTREELIDRSKWEGIQRFLKNQENQNYYLVTDSTTGDILLADSTQPHSYGVPMFGEGNEVESIYLLNDNIYIIC